MSYRLIKGEFHLFYRNAAGRQQGSEPDGDSMWFKPYRRQHLRNLQGRTAKYNKGGFAQLRFEGIDALELHFVGAHQHPVAATGARDSLLQTAGFNQVTYAPTSKIPLRVRTAQPHPLNGYILTRNVDPYGRPVAFVFAGSHRRPSGSDHYLRRQEIRTSLNGRLAAAGHVYPAFYTGLPYDLRLELVGLCRRARQRRLKMHRVERSYARRWSRADSLAQLEKLAVWPKLFRRLVKYFKAHPRGLTRFDGWLRAIPSRDDQIWIISEARLGNMHDIVEVRGDRIRMKYDPDDLIVVPR
ncbi:MAG TPA: hypothetical protein VMY05_09200 [Acidobacteriota bacterium]|nr:hypothetical protein [Acidobacteriota bacterium]